MISTPSQAIQELGGWKAVSERIKRPLTTVASWAARNSIPVEAWPDVIQMAGEVGKPGITYETLTHAHAKKGQKPAKASKRRAA